MEKPLKVRLHIISPVHIGCGDDYEPTNFLIDEKKGKMIVFDPMDFIKTLSPQDKDEFTKICMKGSISSIVEIYNFISRRQVRGREVEIASGLLSDYKRVLSLPTHDERKIRQELNQFAISRTAYNPHNNLPYIPGSSLKGALRTAYLSKLARDKGIREWKNKTKDLEIELLGGSFSSDPFRMVKVSDFIPIGDVKTKIVYAVNKKKKESKFDAGRPRPFQILETIEERAVFEGMINIQQPERIAGIRKPIAAKDLLESINNFYKQIVNEENKIAKEIGAFSIILSKINEKFKDMLGQILIRIGRHSGAEAVTIEGNRWIKISPPGKPHKFSNDGATTIWLASEISKPNINEGLIPFGWVILEIIP